MERKILPEGIEGILQAFKGSAVDILDNLPGGIVCFSDDRQTEFCYVSPGVYRMLGYTPAEFEETFHNRFSRMVYKRDRKRLFSSVEETFASANGQQVYFSNEYRIRRKDGELIWVHDEGHRVQDANGKTWNFALIVDVTASHRLLQSRQILVSCAKQFNSKGKFEYIMNDVLESVLEYYSAKRAYIYMLSNDADMIECKYEVCAPHIEPQIEKRKIVSIETIQRWINEFNAGAEIVYSEIDKLDEVKDARERKVLALRGVSKCVIVSLVNDGRLIGFLGVDEHENDDDEEFLTNLAFFVCGELQKNKLHSQLRHMSFIDNLTKFYNRNAYTAFVGESEKAMLHDVGVVFVDLNSLKYMNDNYGHEYGDKLLMRVAGIIRKNFDTNDLYRISGDEFLAICKGIPRVQFDSCVVKLQADLVSGNEELAAVGSAWTLETTNVRAIVRRAEQEMYANKQAYYNTGTGHIRQSGPLNKMPQKNELLSPVLEHMKKDRFCFYLQPQFDSSDGKLLGAESLVRRFNEEGQEIAPCEFLPLLEKERLIQHLDFFVLESVCKKQREWIDLGYQVVPVHVNFSIQTLSTAGFVDRFIGMCEKYGIQPKLIGIEVTRVRRSSDVEQLREIFNALHCYDVHISCENIGIDSEAINVISLDGLDLVKFDMSLLQQSGDHLKAQIVLQTLIELCHRLGLKCMVCGVETTEQAVLLRSLGCDRLQGFFMEKPMPVGDFQKKYLEDRSVLPIEVTYGAVIAEETLSVDSLDSPVFDLIVQASDKLYIYMANLLKDYSRWSPAAVEYFGLPGEYISNTQNVWNTYLHPEDRNRYRRDVLQVMEGKTDRQMGEYRVKNASGEYVWVRCSGVAKRDRDNSSILFVGTMMNIGSVSKFDPITGLYSSNEFHTRCSKILKDGGGGAIILFGLDNFTRINDVYGYEMGDKILRNIAQNVLIHPMLADCSFFRMDGDKIACLMEDSDRNEIADAFKRIQNVVQTTPRLQNASFHLTASAGAVVFPENGDAPEILRANAECALDDAKRDNRGGITFYSEEMHQKAMNTYRLQEALHKAVSNDCEGFYLNYQPLINGADGTVFGAEALLRFSAPDIPFVSPAEFIPLLEESGEINDVGAWVIKTALKQVVQWRERIPDFCVSVNMSYIQVERPEFKDMVLYELNRSGLGPDALILELTESCKVTNTNQLEVDFKIFKSYDLQVALDDFGTGYASIEVLRKIMPSWVKIDHTFVASISENQLDQAILEYIIQLCRRANIKVVIEGVENEEIYDFLKQYEPELYQGYHFSKPLGTEAFAEKYIY